MEKVTKFEKVLVVMKIAKYLSLDLEGFRNKSQRLSELIQRFETAKSRHEVVCSGIMESMKKYGINYDFTSLKDLTSTIKGYDLVVCLGGDGTFLKAASHIEDDTKIMGLNTDPDRSYCSFSCYNPRIYLLEPDSIWEKMLAGEYDVLKRTRIQMEFIDSQDDSKPPVKWENRYALNEILFAESDVGQATNLRLKADNKDFVPYKGSGVLVSTGSGSTGWVKSTLNIESDIIRDIIWEKEKKMINDREAQSIASRLGSKYYFPPNEDNLFFVIREPVVQTSLDLKKRYKGFAKEITIQSAVKQGSLILDGAITRKIGFGESFILRASPQKLNSIQLTF